MFGQQRAVAQPLQQFIPIRGIHQALQLVFLLERCNAIGDRQQVQVVVTEHGDGAVAQPFDKTQGIEESGPRATRSPQSQSTSFSGSNAARSSRRRKSS